HTQLPPPPNTHTHTLTPIHCYSTLLSSIDSTLQSALHPCWKLIPIAPHSTPSHCSPLCGSRSRSSSSSGSGLKLRLSLLCGGLSLLCGGLSLPMTTALHALSPPLSLACALCRHYTTHPCLNYSRDGHWLSG